jgi:hypothetical protein
MNGIFRAPSSKLRVYNEKNWGCLERATTSTVAMRVVVGNEKGTQCLGLYLGHPVPGGHKYGDLALQVGEVSNLRQ